MGTLTKEQIEQNDRMKDSATELTDKDLQAVSGGVLPDREMEKIRQEVAAWLQSGVGKDDPVMLEKQAKLSKYIVEFSQKAHSYIVDHTKKY
ncbi:MAG: bacteriocin [Bacteroidales bacterium]|nr:bacteriocin [Bacteroidales bacterium]